MKVTTLNFFHRGNEEIRFTYDVNVSKDGCFSTTLPRDAVAKIEAYGVTLDTNRLGNKGYFSSDTMDGLLNKIRAAVDEAVSCELVGTEDIIKYQILICATYCRNKNDETGTELYPNGAGLNGNYEWIDGNVRSDGLSPHPNYFSVYVRPVAIKRYRYKSGRERTEEGRIDEKKYPEDSAIRFINSIVNNFPNGRIEVRQMPCTEENAEFFKKAIISIWKLNEALGRLLKDDTLELAIKSQKLLTD